MSLYDDAEGSIPNGRMIPVYEPTSPPSGTLSSERRRRSHRKEHSGRRKSDRALIHSEASPNELRRLLADRDHESNRLYRALLMAAERLDSEGGRIESMERANLDTIERFKILNESRVAAQQEAMRANQELRLYQFQLETARSEITRAQEALNLAQRQKDEAEEEAARARAQTRLLHQQHVIAAAREEGRKYGFETGFRHAQQEQSMITRRAHQSGRGYRATQPRMRSEEGAYDRFEEPQQGMLPDEGEGIGTDLDQLSRASSPSRLPLRELERDTSPEVIRIAGARRLSQQEQYRQPAHPSHEHQLNNPPPPEPIPVIHPTPDVTRSFSPGPSVQVYSIDIPSTTQIEKEFNPNENFNDRSQWITAQEHLEMSGQQPGQAEFQEQGQDLSRSMSMSQPTAGQNRKRKESWYRTLSRRAFRFGRKSEPANGSTRNSLQMQSQPPEQGSWYVPKPNPPVHVRDYAVPKPRSSVDAASISTRMSQLELISPPNRTPNGSVLGQSSGASGLGRKLKEKKTKLHVINEDSMSREVTPAKNNWHQRAQSEDSGRASVLTQSRSHGRQWEGEEAGYSDPRVNESRRRPDNHRAPMGPPPNIRRPVKLTMPAPLAPESTQASRSYAMSNNTATSSHSQFESDANHQDFRRAGHNLTIDPELSPPGISIVPPSQSPSETFITRSTRNSNGHLSPNQSHHSLLPQSIRSAPSVPAFPNSPKPIHGDILYEPETHRRSSRASTRNDRNGHSSGQQYNHSTPTPVSQLSYEEEPSRPGSVRSSSPHHNIRSRHSDRSVSTGSPSYIPRPLVPGPEPRSEVSRGKQRAMTPTISERNLPQGNAEYDEHTLNRVPSNISVRSAASRYAHYDPSTYLDPAYFSINDATDTRSKTGAVPFGPWSQRATSNSSSLS